MVAVWAMWMFMRILKIESYSKVLPRYSHHAYLRVYVMMADVYLDLCACTLMACRGPTQCVTYTTIRNPL